MNLKYCTNIMTIMPPSYKRTIGILVLFIVTLSIPITLSLLSQRQDIRQQAQVPVSDTSTINSLNPTITPSPTAIVSPTKALTPTPLSAQNDTRLLLNISLPGIGLQGFGSNSNPLRKERLLDIKIIDTSNQEMRSISGAKAVYDAQNANYKSTISLGEAFPTGSYLIKMRFDNTLWTDFPQTQLITAKILNTPSQISLVSGDINNAGENEINLIDYNLMISCINNLKSCSQNAKNLSDLNDDGKTDSVDLNILLAGFTKRQGK